MKFLERISFEDTNRFSKIVLDYLSGNSKLQEYFSVPLHIQAIKQSILTRHKVDRQLLTSQIRTTYADLPVNEKVNAHIEALNDERTFTVVVAHQPLLFGGPLYFFYKILNAVAVCEFLKKEIPEYNFVPIYYLGSEDDDIAEVGQVNFRKKTYRWEPIEKGPVGRLPIHSMYSILDEIIHAINPRIENGKRLIQILKIAYNKSTFSEATISMVHELLGDYGVVIFDPDKAEYKRAFIPFFEQEVKEFKSHRAVKKTIETLSQDYKIQATSRDVNLFYAPGHLRTRIEYIDGQYTTPEGNRWTQEEILGEIHLHPEHFSTNVITRPLYQEYFLPNCIFIGGGGELAYWLQLKSSFEAYGLHFPALLLRNSFQIFSEKQLSKVKRLNLSLSDLFLDHNDIHKKIVSHTITEWDVQSIKEKHLAALAEYKNLDSGIDPTIRQSIEAHSKRIAHIHDRLAERFYRAAKRKHGQEIELVNGLLTESYLSYGLQERHENFIDYYLAYGIAFFDHLLTYMKSLNPSFVLLSSSES